MSDADNRWQNELIEKLASAALHEQRRARRWGIFFKLLTFAYLTFLLVAFVDWGQSTDMDGSGSSGGKHTALVEIDGLISPGSDGSADKVNAALRHAFKDQNTQGVVLRINSPGGSPVQAQDIYDEIRRLRAKYPQIPIYAVIEDICASGGYYVAAATDRIYVGRSSIVGSIGVRMDSFGFTGLMEKLGVERRLLTSGDDKGLLDPFLPVDEHQKQHVISMMKEIHEQFIASVREGRGKRLKEVPELFSGLIWSGQKSVELGLADAVGNLSYVSREVIKAEDIRNYTQKDNIAEKFARRFGAGVATALIEATQRVAPVLR
jgi:protease-4